MGLVKMNGSSDGQEGAIAVYRGGLFKTQVIGVKEIRTGKLIGNRIHVDLNNRQRLLQSIERRFLHQTFTDGETVAVRAYVRTGRKATRRT
jgi:hypothetical protein